MDKTLISFVSKDHYYKMAGRAFMVAKEIAPS